jgi:FMN phosphatase YigB (HAD superfamily)
LPPAARPTAQQLLARRRAIAARLRKRAAEAGNDPEYTFAELIAALVAETLPDDGDCPDFRNCENGTVPLGPSAIHAELVAAAIAFECELERSVTAPMPGMRELLCDLRRAGKQIVLCSDMYLPAAQIAALLSENGYDLNGVRLYVSCEHGRSKASGRLFQRWIEAERVVPQRAVHVGDNPAADIEAARRVGLRAIRFYEPSETARRRRVETLKRRAAGNAFWKGAYLFAVSDPLQHQPPRPDFHYDYGRRLLGPAYTVFLHRVVEQVAQHGIEQLVFVAREGFLFRKVYDLLAPRLLPAAERPPTSYACLSRASTALAIEHPDTHLAGPHFAVGRGGQRELLADYLAQCGFWGRGRRVGLVDIGWQGTIARQLRQAFAQRPDFPDLHEFYFGHCNVESSDDSRSAIIAPFRGAKGDARDFDMQPALDFRPLFEEAARAPHGTTLAYDRTPCGVVPRCKAATAPGRAAELECNPALAAMQQGILDFAAGYAETVAWMGHAAADVQPYLSLLLTRIVCLPRRDEARGLLGWLHHAADAAGNQCDSLGAAAFYPWRLDAWRDLLRAGNGPRWRPGVLAGAHRGLAWLYSLANCVRRWSH